MIKFSNKTKVVKHFNDKVTFVTIGGHFQMPEYILFSDKILEWINKHPLTNFWYGGSGYLEVIGRATKCDTDTFDPVFGERLAEARAKKYLFWILYRVCEMFLEELSKNIGLNMDNIRDTARDDSAESKTLLSDIRKYYNLYMKEAQHVEQLLKHN